MKKIFILLLSSACSTIQTELPKFDSEVNCTDRARSVIKLRDTKNTHSTGFQSKESKANIAKREARQNEGRDLVLVSAYPKLAACYQTYLNLNNYGKFNVCAVLAIDEKGVLGFIDIEDNDNKLPPSLFSCMLDEIVKINFKHYPSTVIDLALPFDYSIKRSIQYQPGR